jgi:uncharacterized protein with von Willebrand factor type A (vWA) domain
MIEMLSVSFMGGTSYVSPLNYAMSVIETDKFKNSDIIMVTDDACRLPDYMVEKIVNFKKEHDVKITMINIGGYLDKEDISRWVDNVYTDLGDETLTEVYKNV